MPEPKDITQRQDGGAAKVWPNWFLMFAPLFLAAMIGTRWFGFAVMIPVTIALLGGALLHQRYVKKRSWGAILWGRIEPQDR